MSSYIAVNLWGKDHWSTLAYVETVMVECAGFQIGSDARMRSNRRNFRVMHEQCRHPKRPERSTASMAVSMVPQHGTRLNNGTKVEDHDDWACIQDMAQAGLFTVSVDAVEPKQVLHFSPIGSTIAVQLRNHKAAGGMFATFKP